MSSRKPLNIVIINPDQMRWDFASCYGHPFIGTRHLDQLAETGTRFDLAFTAAPTCGPSRTSFLTGQYPCEHGVREYGGALDPAYPNALAKLGEADYVRGLWGKDHVFKGQTIGRHYDEGEDVCIGAMLSHPDYIRAWDCAALDPESEWNTTRRFTDGGLDFIRRHAHGPRPFFLTLNYQDPHPFFACPEPYASLFDPAQFMLPENYRRAPVPGEPRRLTHWRIHSGETEMPEHELRRAMAMYCGQIRYVDDQIGRVMALLEEMGIAQSTLVLFWSDHGEFIGDFGVTHKIPAFYECLVRVPLVLRDPTGRIARGVYDAPVELMDAMATLLDLCAVDQPAGSRARSLLANQPPRTDVFAEAGLIVQQPAAPIEGLRLKAAQAPTLFGAGAMLRTRTWKLCQYAEDQGELFNVAEDPMELRNRFDDPACLQVRSMLQQRLIQRLLCKGQAPEDLAAGSPPYHGG